MQLQFAKKLPLLHGFPASGAQTAEVVHCKEGVSAELMLWGTRRQNEWFWGSNSKPVGGIVSNSRLDDMEAICWCFVLAQFSLLTPLSWLCDASMLCALKQAGGRQTSGIDMRTWEEQMGFWAKNSFSYSATLPHSFSPLSCSPCVHATPVCNSSLRNKQGRFGRRHGFDL